MTQSQIPNPKSQNIPIGGIVLAGGRSTRMGMPKATLPFGPELMLQRMVRLLSGVVKPIVVVAAPGSEAGGLPVLSAGVIVTYDEREGRGPLEGLLAGLTAMQPHAEAAYVTSCDVPLLVPEFVQEMISRLGDAQIAVPFEEGFPHPLAAVYRTSVLPQIHELLASERLRPAFLFECVETRRVPVADLRSVDPQLTTLKNLNRPDDYLEALAEAGFAPDPEIVARFGNDRT